MCTDTLCSRQVKFQSSFRQHKPFLRSCRKKKNRSSLSLWSFRALETFFSQQKDPKPRGMSSKHSKASKQIAGIKTMKKRVFDHPHEKRQWRYRSIKTRSCEYIRDILWQTAHLKRHKRFKEQIMKISNGVVAQKMKDDGSQRKKRNRRAREPQRRIPIRSEHTKHRK